MKNDVAIANAQKVPTRPHTSHKAKRPRDNKYKAPSPDIQQAAAFSALEDKHSEEILTHEERCCEQNDAGYNIYTHRDAPSSSPSSSPEGVR